MAPLDLIRAVLQQNQKNMVSFGEKQSTGIKREKFYSSIRRARHFPWNAFDHKMAFVKMKTFCRDVTFLQKSDIVLMVPFQITRLP